MNKIAITIFIFLFFSKNAAGNDSNYLITFGALKVDDDYYDFMYETETVKLIPKSEGYAVGIRVIPKHEGSYNYYTVSYLPSKPEKVGGLFEKNSDQMYDSGMKSPQLITSGSIIIPFWFDEGDPLGVYKIDVYIDGAHQKSVEFNVVSED